jgi:DNA polymerase III subunit epsilon
MSGYTVIDVETTGFVPEKYDRVVEIGVVFVSHRGEIQDHWSTLVNPQRDVGPTHVHGITASDVAGAPTFAEIAPYVLHAVSGRTIVAHNASFDLRFLAHELLRAGVPLASLPLHGLCTMHWSTAFLHAPSRKLVDCCHACGVDLQEAHSAGADALATAGLLSYYLQQSQWQPPWVDVLTEARGYGWPTYHGPYPELRFARRAEVRAARREDAWLDRIVSRMPRAADARVDAYLAVLEMALLDGFLAEHEKEQLVAVATESGLSRGQVLDLHAGYLRAMAEVALDDGVVTCEERADLEKVATYLGLQSIDVDAALSDAAENRSSGSAVTSLATSGIVLCPGDRVVFTGEMRRPRTEWEEACRIVGLEPGTVTKATRVVVAADPNSLSGKAAKARSYGIPIITEDAFERILRAQAPALA